MAAAPPTGSSPAPFKRRPWPGAVVLAVIAAAVLIWLLVRGGNDDKKAQVTPATPTRAVPVLASGKSLRKVAATVGFPIYWAGRVPKRKVELSQTRTGNVFIRYLAPDAPVGDKRPLFLTVGTYPLPNAYAAVKNAAKKPGTISRRVARDGLAVYGANSKSAYFAYPGARVQVEVFSPTPGRALQLIMGGRIRAIAR